MRRGRVAWAGVTLLTGCGAPAQPAPAAGAPALEEIFADLCPANHRHRADCDLFPRCDQHPACDDQSNSVAGASGRWTLSALAPGPFTSPSADEVAVWLDSPDLAFPAYQGGYLLLLRHVEGAWLAVASSREIPLSTCVGLTSTDGRKRLACVRSAVSDGITSSWVELFDLGRLPLGGALVLGTSSGSLCGPPYGDASIAPGLTIDASGTEVDARVTRMQGHVSATYSCGDPMPLGPPQTSLLRLSWDGVRLKPTADTRTLVERLPR